MGNRLKQKTFSAMLFVDISLKRSRVTIVSGVISPPQAVMTNAPSTPGGAFANLFA